MKEMMKIIENETNIVFLFEIEDLQNVIQNHLQNNKDDKEVNNFNNNLKIKINNKILTIDQFIKQFNSDDLTDYIFSNLSVFQRNEYYLLNMFIEMEENEF